MQRYPSSNFSGYMKPNHAHVFIIVVSDEVRLVEFTQHCLDESIDTFLS